ncbi:MAG: DUF7560 family zinc ribbon protein [Halobacteriota archaeon]|uniref:DUF7560 family zinc ribbon protein n=1 Tax=Halanaeroarchaeum sp. HSR-CO TaxID=2866382 RepID=UPI00217E5654|nr:hypothetical protein [Halanaeroarchaeum sp. HSR-CO]UWG46802.1 Zn ribbon containing protein [Halanaeroarchaeum sp. HSR-CO]
MMERYRFDCPNCEIDIVVDSGVRSDFLENGCPICGGSARRSDFYLLEATEESQSA